MPTMSRRTRPADSASPGSGGGRRQGRQAAGRRDSEPRGAVGDMGPAQARLGTGPEAHPRWAGLR